MTATMADADGGARTFALPVDTEHKALAMRPWWFHRPHMISFHLAWSSFFAAWISTFAPAALLPIIRESIDLDRVALGNANIAAVCGAILGRIVMGAAVDNYGPRTGIAFCLGLTAPAVFGIALVTSGNAFVVSRLIIGFTLSNFVACQFWCTSTFNPKVVATANSFGAGMGNMGGGFALLLMPLVFEGIVTKMGITPFIAWRWSFLVPGCFQLLMTAGVLLLAQDLPDGNYSDLKRAGVMRKQNAWRMWRAALGNYRTWVMTITYGYCFGVELTMNNLLTQYMFDQFSLNLRVAGLLASVFGLMNIVSRPSGGLLSDWVARRWGIRGRLWALWTTQTLAGLFCMVLGLVSNSLPATMAVMICLSIFCQQSSGLSFGVVPFVSKRSTGLVSGLVGAGGNAGAAANQAMFFTYATWGTAQGFFYLGIMAMGMTLMYALVYFPMWGGMLVRRNDNVSEEDYYMAEYTPEERAQNLHTGSLKFAFESRSQRGGNSWRKSLTDGTRSTSPSSSMAGIRQLS